ncbi:VanW family protein [Tissierella carlieri]|uniref:VanW family protein n=1 Tax=Tissierella carlieri TaxID=689904 RepID=UPI001C0FB8FD|nr:VanW family protein [Tissierella carlieri]MBU5312260.1 VanW family protein [Tissierella carlieri]
MDKFKLTILPISLAILLSTKSYAISNPILDNKFTIVNSEPEFMINKRNERYDIPEVSGEVSNMPWRNDKEFLKAKDKYDTHTLIAGFCAVLKNPLPGEEYNVSLASQKVKGQVIKSSKIFSQNSAIGPYTKLRGFREGASYIGGNIIMTEGGGVCKIATTLYNLAVLSNLEVIERHNHSMPVNYVPYGQDATVAYGVKDLRFKNTTENSILIWAEMIGNRLYMGFYGSEKPPKVIWNHEVSNVTTPPVKYIKNENLKQGEMKTVLGGMDGATVKSTITIFYNDEHYIIKNMGISHYEPLPKVIETN